MFKATATFILVFLALAAAGCGGNENTEFKPALDVMGRSILLDDGREVQIRVYDAHLECHRVLDSFEGVSLTSGDPNLLGEREDDLFLDINLADYDEDPLSLSSGCEER
jgi:hypothetical protein